MMPRPVLTLSFFKYRDKNQTHTYLVSSAVWEQDPAATTGPYPTEVGRQNFLIDETCDNVKLVMVLNVSFGVDAQDLWVLVTDELEL